MKKIVLFVFVTMLSLTANAKLVLEMSGSDWSGSGKVTWNADTKTFTFAEGWKNGGMWMGADLTGYTHLCIKTVKNVGYTLEVQGDNGGTKVSYSVGAGTSDQVIIVPIPGDVSNFGGISFGGREAGDIQFTEIAAVTMSEVQVAETAITVEPSMWPKEGEDGCVTPTAYDNGAITMGTYTDESKWCGVQWWLGWNEAEEKNSGSDYSAYDMAIVTFSASPSKDSGVKLEYTNADEGDNGNSYVNMWNGINTAFVPLDPDKSARIKTISFQAPQQATATVESIKFVKYSDVSTGISTVNRAAATVNQIFDLQGRRVAQPTKGLYIVNGKKVVIK